MNRVVQYIIRAKDATAAGISGAMSRIKGFVAGVGKNLANIQAGFQMLAQAAQKAWKILQKSFEFEKLTYQFKTLIGNLDDARAHMAMLQDMGNTPPFSLEEFAKASREMMVMSDGVLGFKDSLTLVGDVAAATGQPIDALANAVGRAYATIRDGQPVTRATMQLRNMGAITPAVAQKLDDLQKSGASNIEIWRELEDSLKKHKGAMEETEKTADGLMGAISSRWDNIVRAFGSAFLESAKGGMKTMLDAMTDLENSGSIEYWADKACSKLGEVLEVCGAVAKAIRGIWDYLGFSDAWAVIDATVGGTAAYLTAGFTGMAEGQGFLDSWNNATQIANDYSGKALAGGFYMGKLAENGWLGSDMKRYKAELDDDNEYEANRKEEFKRRIREKKEKATAEAKEKAEQLEAEKKLQLEQEMADKQAEIDQKRYEEELAEYYRLLEEEEAAYQRMLEDEAAEKARLDAEAHNRAVKFAQEEASASESEQRDAMSRLQAAQNAVQKAWGWYKNKDTMQGEIDAYNQQKAAEVQWEKDFAKLKDKRRDWRDVEFGKLSAEEEAVRQVALAKEEEKAAQVALDEIAENTAYLKSIADALTNEEGA